MTAAAVPFLFDRDFRARPVPEDAPVPGVRHRAEVARAEEVGLQRGLAEGRRAALGDEAARLAASLDRLAGALAAEISRVRARDGEREAAAIELALAVAEKLAGGALARFPTAALEAAALQCFQEARQAPHLVVRVSEDLVEAVKTRLVRLAADSGFTGKLLVFGEPDIAPGDGRLEWADGGIVRDRAAIAAAIARAFDQHLVPAGPAAGDRHE